jgi:hypothetical protein
MGRHSGSQDEFPTLRRCGICCLGIRDLKTSTRPFVVAASAASAFGISRRVPDPSSLRHLLPRHSGSQDEYPTLRRCGICCLGIRDLKTSSRPFVVAASAASAFGISRRVPDPSSLRHLLPRHSGSQDEFLTLRRCGICCLGVRDINFFRVML